MILEPEDDIVLDKYLKLRKDRIEVCFVDPDRQFAKDTASSLVNAASKLAEYFEVNGPLPLIRAILAPDRDAFDVLVADLLDVRIERPSDPRRIAQPQKTDIVFLSPSAYATQSTYTYVPDDFQRMATHELVHVVQELLSPGIEESPLWWDEGLAVYLSNQWQHTSQFRFREPVLQSIQDGHAPTLSAIQTDNSLAYSFGWTLVRFIEQEMGKTAIVSVVKQMMDGDVFTALGVVDAVSFQEAWQAWLLKGAGSRP
jgi:peptidase MA superfamily protein